ncbi:MAG: diguanylate cyclase [Acidimicrobiales bacterium]
MIEPPIPDDDPQRVASLRALDLLDTPPEERFDRITRLAQRLFGVPMATVTLVDEDRQWFKSRIGIDVAETPRSESFCGHAIASGEALLVADARLDERFVDNPSVLDDPNIRFYAGIPLSAPDGARVGTLCVMDDVPREIDPDDVAALEDLALMVEHEIAVRHLAVNDELTGLSNRRGFLLQGRKVLEVCRRLGQPATLLFADLDGLKAVNDEQGHEAGDVAIRRAADVLAGSLRGADVLARLGGDEFCALLSGTADPSAVIERLQHAILVHGPDGATSLGMSVGVATFDPGAPVDLEALMASGDAAMYDQKRSKPGAR